MGWQARNGNTNIPSGIKRELKSDWFNFVNTNKCAGMNAYNWKPVEQTVIKDEELAAQVNNEGFKVVAFLSEEELVKLDDLYAQNHSIKQQDGGMFYSVYSKDVEYRKIVHESIGKIIEQALERFLKDYRVVLNAFVIKAPGKKSEFSIHQDGTGLDELTYSPLSIWFPLQNTDIANGTLCVIPRSHRMFSPYRGISFPAPYDKIQPTLKRYLQPIPLKRGEAIFFDNRLIHNSTNNLSDKNRVAIVSSIFPAKAKVITCYKHPSDKSNPIELIEHEDSFLLEYDGFLENCHLKPNSGHTINTVNDLTKEISDMEFDQLCNEYGVTAYKGERIFNNGESCNMIGEPITDEK